MEIQQTLFWVSLLFLLVGVIASLINKRTKPFDLVYCIQNRNNRNFVKFVNIGNSSPRTITRDYQSEPYEVVRFKDATLMTKSSAEYLANLLGPMYKILKMEVRLAEVIEVSKNGR